MWRVFLVSLVLLLLASFSPVNAQIDARAGSRAPDEQAIRKVLAGYDDSWATHDQEKRLKLFAEDADATVVTGRTLHGRAAIRDNPRSALFQRMYGNAIQKFQDISVRFITPEVAAVDARWVMTGARHEDGSPWPDRQGLMSLIMTKEAGVWVIKVFHNMETSARPSDKIEQVIRRLENERREAILHSDVKALDGLMADDFVVTTINGRVFHKADELALYRDGSRKLQSWDADDIKVRVYGDVAVVTGRATVKDSLGDRIRDFQFRFTHLWAKAQGRWQLIVRHATEIAR